MKSAQNQKVLRVFIRDFSEKLQKEVKQTNQTLNKQKIAEIAKSIIQLESPKRQESSYSDLRSIINQNQELILQQQQQIAHLQAKMRIEDEMTRKFIQNLLKDKNSVHQQKERVFKKQTSLIQLHPVPTISNFSLAESVIRSPSQDTKQNCQHNVLDTPAYRQCSTSRSNSRLNKSKFQASQYAQEVEPDEKQKSKALCKLRKLEKYVFERQNKKSKFKEQRIWNYGVSPTKKFYKEQNNNLKVVNANLMTHLQLLQKFRDIPSIEGLVAREEAMKKKESILKELDETLTKKELELTKKQSQFLKRQKSTKLL